jgi:hypothetical protein
MPGNRQNARGTSIRDDWHTVVRMGERAETHHAGRSVVLHINLSRREFGHCEAPDLRDLQGRLPSRLEYASCPDTVSWTMLWVSPQKVMVTVARLKLRLPI